MLPTLDLTITEANSVSENYVILGDFDDLFRMMPDDCVDVVYADPPFNAGGTRRDPRDRDVSFRDDASFEDWLAMIGRLAVSARRVLRASGSFFLHLDGHGVHEAKVMAVDPAFGRRSFLGDLVWSYDWGARQKDRFALKHDTILHYVKDVERHLFDHTRQDHVPYRAPELQRLRERRLGRDDADERIARGKFVTDVFTDINIVGTNSKERRLNSYPTMKPTRLIRRLLAPVVRSGSLVIDPFCGSGPTVDAAIDLGCRFIVGDINERAIELTVERAERRDASVKRLLSTVEELL